MNEKDFLMNYLWPSGNRLDRTFTHPLLDIEGLKNCGDFIVQGEVEETFSTNIITKYVSDTSGVRLVEVYKNTQHKRTGVFVRLVGSLSLVKTGYPFLFLDAPVLNVNPRTGEKEELTTRVSIHLPQADSEQRRVFFDYLSEQAKKEGISYRDWEPDTMPDFWGSVWLGESKRLDLDMIRKLRDYAWVAYKSIIEKTTEKTPFDYRPLQEHNIFNTSRREHVVFERMGLSVTVEAQAAFFSVLVSGV